MVLVLSMSLFTACGKEEQSEDISVASTDREVFEIETDYCLLEYPEEWNDQVTTEVDDSTPYTVKFSTKVDKKKVPLFDLVFGGDKGFKLGTLSTGDEKVDLYIINHDFDEKDFSDEDYKVLCDMCHDVNVIISKLVEGGNFEVAE